MNTKQNILLAEDDPQDEASILQVLNKINLANQIDVVRDGRQALDYMFRQGAFSNREPTPPAIVMLDISLPILSGIEVLDRLRGDESTRLQPVLLLASTDEERNRLKKQSTGANGCLRKPIDFAEFAHAAARLGLYWVATGVAPNT